MQPSVTPIFHKPTSTWTYVVADPATREAAVIDPVLDYDWRSARTGTASADEILVHLESAGSSCAGSSRPMRMPTTCPRHPTSRLAPAARSRLARASARCRLRSSACSASVRISSRTAASSTGCWPMARRSKSAGSQAASSRRRATPATAFPTCSATRCSLATRFSCPTAVRPAATSRAATPRNCTDRSSASMTCLRRRACSSATTTRPVGARFAANDDRRAALRQHPRPGRHARGGLRGDAPHARRHARRPEPDHPVGAGQHPRRLPAACRADGVSYLKVPLDVIGRPLPTSHS
jgi:hypothetical protein